MKEVSRRKLDCILKKSINFSGCRCNSCGMPCSVEIVVVMPMYGREGAYIKCGRCGSVLTKTYPINDCFTDETGRLATPVTHKSLLRGILHAVSDYKAVSKRGIKDEVEKN